MSKELIVLYSENAREKLKTASAILKKSSQRLKYTLKKIEKEGIIYDPHCVFDYSYFGLLLFRVYFKGGYISEKDKIDIIKKLSKNPYITSIYELSGEFDLAIEIEAPNPSRFNKELRRVSSLIPTLRKYKIILNIVTHLYTRSYLTKNTEVINNIPREIIFGGDRERKEFSSSETKVIRQIRENPRIRLSALARKAELNIRTAKSVIKSLENKKIIRGFKYVLDTTKLDIYKFRLFLNTHNLSKEREDQLREYVFKTKEMIQLNKTVGDWDIEVDIESLNKNVIRQLIIELRENFKEIIEDFNIIEFYKYYKRTYLPEFLFQEEENQAGDSIQKAQS